MYSALFRITHNEVTPRALPADTLDPTIRKCLGIAAVAWDVYLEDLRQTVSKKVMKDVESNRRGATVMETTRTTDGARHDDTMTMERDDYDKQRQKHLQKWIKCHNPLSVGKDSQTGISSWQSLVIAMSPDLASQSQGLPSPPGIRTVSVREAALGLASTGPTHIQAPALSGGSCFPSVVALANTFIDKHGRDHPLDAEQWRVSIWVLFLHRHKIAILPWKSGRGRRHQQATIQYWTSIIHSKTEIGAAEHDVDVRNHQSNLDRMEEELINNDPSRAWSIRDMRIQDLIKILELEQLPEEWTDDKYPADSGSLGQTYRHIHRTYNNSNPIHRLMMIMGFLFYKAVPFVCRSKTTTQAIKPGQDTTEIVRHTPWLADHGRRGMQEKTWQHGHMFFTYCLSLVEPSSPLLQKLKRGDVMGETWSGPHCE